MTEKSVKEYKGDSILESWKSEKFLQLTSIKALNRFVNKRGKIRLD